WGASYLVHDFYRQFIRSDGSEKHYVLAGRIATATLFLCASVLTFFLDSAKDTFDLILQIGAGTGLLYLARWFWWRINAWCEVAAMVSSFAASVVVFVLNHHGAAIGTDAALLITIGATTVCWVATAYLGPQTDPKVLIEFYKKVRPFGPGWRQVRKAAGFGPEDEERAGENIPLSLLGWVAGCATIWSSLFAVGNFIYGWYRSATLLLAVFVASGATLIYVVNRLWTGSEDAKGERSRGETEAAPRH
ncbi:MAG TPA: Na+:solute symporter, partial [Verrucomicrobiae bacterium]|nr:Na+:solute symporter [Verrucomicrobiae bacterium]